MIPRAPHYAFSDLLIRDQYDDDDDVPAINHGMSAYITFTLVVSLYDIVGDYSAQTFSVGS